MIGAVFVSYRSAALAAAAIESLRADAAGAGETAFVVAVVTSEDPAERDALAPLADATVLTPGNAGFAGGLNAGLDRVRGDVVLLANPDVLFLPGSVAALAGAVAGPDPVAAGPAFFSDRECTLFQPPADEPRPMELVRRRLGRGAEAAAERLFRRDLRRALAARGAARSGAAVGATALRGAVVAVNRRALDLAGPFDEGYRLYYEENDWQRRLRALKGRLVYAGGAHVVHFYNQSARTEPRAAGWFAASERRYFLAHFGEAGRAALEADVAAPPGPPPRVLPLLRGGQLPLPPREGPLLVAVSPSPAFRPVLLSDAPPGAPWWQLPREAAEAMRGGRWFARAFDPSTLETLSEGELGEA